jgi:predicted ATPase
VYPVKRWRLRNFKSVAEAEVGFSPLTVLVGANSSGKSSLIQSILLVVQAAQSYSAEAALPLNGSHVELGDFGDLRFAGATTRDRVVIGGAFSLPGRSQAMRGGLEEPSSRLTAQRTRFEWEVELLNTGRDDPPGRANLRRVQFSAPSPEEVIERYREGPVLFEATKRSRKPLELSPAPRRAHYHAIVPLGGRLKVQTASGDARSVRTAGFAHRAGIPVSLFVKGDQNSVLAGEWVRRARHVLRDRRKNPRTDWDRIRDRRGRERTEGRSDRSREPMNQLATDACDRLIDLIVAAVEADGEPFPGRAQAAAEVFKRVEELRTESVSKGFWLQLHSLVNDRKFPRAIERRLGRGEPLLLPAEEDERCRVLAHNLETGGSAVAAFMANRVIYLGPLRQDPQVLYLAAPTEQPGFVGKKGEFAFAVLHKHANQPVVCPLTDGKTSVMPLREAVNHWLVEFGLAESIETLYRPRLGLEPQIQLAGVDRPLDMTAVGVGVSQLLPVLVMGLHSDPGSVLLVEQPELHLHPAMQQKLGDFLLACVRSGRQVIVETHSDHLVTRLRRRIAEDEEDRTVDLVGLVFTERLDGRTEFRRLEPNRYGGLDDWPKGFFDQGTTDSQRLLRAGMRKKRIDS